MVAPKITRPEDAQQQVQQAQAKNQTKPKAATTPAQPTPTAKPTASTNPPMSDTLRLAWENQNTNFNMRAALNGPLPYGYGWNPAPSYWEEPSRVARYVDFAKSAPPNWTPPPWVNGQALQSAYSYLKQRNGNKPWQLWERLPEDDPGTGFLRSIPMPPPEFMPEPEARRYYSWQPQIDSSNVYAVDLNLLQQAGLDANQFKVENGKALIPASMLDKFTDPTATYQPQQPQQLTSGIPKEQWDRLPFWQKAIIPILPAMNTALGAGSGAIAGFGVGGPVGALIGGAAGGGATYATEKNETLANLMMKLDIPAEALERAIGFVGQLGFSIQDPDKYGALSEVLNNLPAAWEAGSLAYNASFSDITSNQITAWELGNPDPKVWQTPEGQMASGWAMTEARRRIAKGEAPEQVWEDIGARFGFAGTVRDMVGHMFLDPLNYFGEATNFAGSKLAKAAGNTELSKAFAANKETLGALRQYGQALRRLPPEEAARFGAVSRWVAGLDATGKIAEFQPGKPGNVLDYMRGLDPTSRALEVLSTSVDGINVALSDITDPEQVVKTLRAVAKMEPKQAVDALDGSPLPRWFQSAEAQAVPVAMRDQMTVIDGMLDQWKMTRGQATIIERIAGYMDMTPEALMAKLHNGKAAEADALYRSFFERIQARAQGGDQAAARIAQALGSDSMNGLDGRKLKQMADLFVGEDSAPFRPEAFKYRVMVKLTEGVDQWAAKWFNVKPAGWAVRMGNVIKKAQGLALLGLNPTYVINNALNNMVTLAYDGLLGLSSPRSRKQFLNDLGIQPSRLRQGLNPGEIGDAGMMGTAIRDAAKDKGALQALQDFFGKGDKLAIFAGMSKKVEEWSSEMAMVTAMRQFWDRTWREGVGFDKMPSDLRLALDAVQPGMADQVQRAIRRGKSRATIEREVFERLSVKSVRDVVSQDEAGLMAHFPEVFEDLDRKVQEAKEPEAIRIAFDEARTGLQQRVAQEVARGVEKITNDAATTIRVEGAQGVLDIADNLSQSRAQFWLEHFRKMDEVATQAAQLTGASRRALWQNALSAADRDWKTFKNIEGAKWLGMFKGLGADEPTYNQALQHLWDQYDNWNAFYESRRTLMNNFFDQAEGLDDAARSALWREVNQKLNGEYVDALLEEDRLQALVDDLFAQSSVKRQPDMTQGAVVWRESVRVARRRMTQVMVMFRAGEVPAPMLQAFGDLLPAEMKTAISVLNSGQPLFALERSVRDVVNKKFYGEIYTPMIREMLETSNRNTPGMRLPPGSGPALVARTPGEAAAWRAVVAVKPDLAGVDATGRPVPGAKLDVLKWVLKNNPEARGRVRKFADLTPDDIARAAERETARAGTQPELTPYDGPDISTESQWKPPAEFELGNNGARTDQPELTPYEEPIQASPVPDTEPVAKIDTGGLTGRARAFVVRGVDMLPPNVRDRVWETARLMTSELREARSVVNRETHQVMREGPMWYWQLYDTSEKAEQKTLHRRLDKILWDIVAGREKVGDNLVERAKAIMLDWLSGGSNHEAYGDMTDPAVLWYLGEKDKVAQFVNDKMQDMGGEEWARIFGSGAVADDVAAYWVEWLSKQEGGLADEIDAGPVIDPQAGAANAARAAELEGGAQAVIESAPVRMAEEATTPVQEVAAQEVPVMAEAGQGNGRPVETGPAPEPVVSPRGTAAQVIEPPLQEAQWEGWLRALSPLMDQVEGRLTSAGDSVFAMENVGPDVQRRLRGYLGQVYEQLSEAKMGALRWGESKRDAALLNYNRRYGFDNALGVAMPYEYWYTHSLYQWALRALNKPAIFANYARLQNFAETAVEREGFPTRLKGKVKIPLPFLPDWMGDGVYIDVNRQIFPFQNFARPWEALAQQNNHLERRAEGILQQQVADESMTAEEAAQAAQSKSGPAWEQAMAQARNETDLEIANPLDFAFMMSGPSLPVSIAYNVATGRADQIGQLPVTRMIQATTGALGLGGPRGFNIEAPLRRATGLPEVDAYEDYRVDRMLAGLAAEGLISAEDAKLAMIDRTGPAFELAQQRVSQMGVWQYWGAPLSVDFFPEGEAEQRQLKTEYDRAITAWKGGDKQALRSFFDQYPEYEARMASFQEPEERLKRFMIAEVWDRYNELPVLYQRQAREQFGDVFNDAFLSKETRSYESLSTQTLATWSRALKAGAPLPAASPETPAVSLKLADPETAGVVQGYYDEKDKRFPNIGQVLDLYYQLPDESKAQFRAAYPQYDEYQRWRTAYLADHPSAIPWLVGEQNELYGLPVELQGYVYSYRAEKDRRYPNIEQLQDQYFALPENQRRAFRREHPELAEYWDWRKQAAALYPNAAPYILSDQSLRNAILGPEQASQMQPALSPSIMQQLSPALVRQLLGHLYAGQQLSTGAVMELQRVWKKAGQPGGDMQTWIDSLK